MELRLIVEAGERRREFEFELDEAAPGAALYAAIAPKIGLAADGFGLRLIRVNESIHPEAPVADYELRTADRLEVVAERPGGSYRADAVWLLETAGAGTIALPPGDTELGRDDEPGTPLHDDAISRRHAVVTATPQTLTIADAGSTNGTFVNDVEIGDPAELRTGDRVLLGGTTLQVSRPAARPALPTHITYGSGALAFNRPPRVTAEAPERTFELAAAPRTPTKQRLPLAASFVPMLMGLGLFAMTAVGGTPQYRYLFFMLGSPLMMIATFISNRRSGRSDFKLERAAYLESIDRTRRDAAAAAKAAVEWRRRRDADPGVLVRDAAALAPTLWHRRPGDEDFLQVRLGTADQPSLVSVKVANGGDDELAGAARKMAEHFTIDAGVPFVLSLGEAGVTGIVGTRERTAADARWLAAQLAATHSPREMGLVVIAPEEEASWDWAKWLPHVTVLSATTVSIATDDNRAAALFQALRSIVEQRDSVRDGLIGSGTRRFLPHLVVMMVPPVRLAARAVAEFLEQAPHLGVSVVWFAEERTALPGTCRVVIEDHNATASVTFASEGRVVPAVRIDEFAENDAAGLAIALAPLRDAAAAASDAGIPDRIDLMDLLEPAPGTADAVTTRWQAASDSLAAVLGVGETGPVAVDIVRDGPHGLLGGTTGSGKSELLQTLIASLAVTYPPDRVNLVLIDYKGGAAFKDCVDLPHTVGFVTDLDGRLADRAIASLNAELRWREHVLADGGYKDLAEMRAKVPADAPPSLLLIVDEFAALKSEVPAFIDGVVDIAQRGRSLGVHLLLATQKPGGIISAAIQANTNLRIALRVTDSGESTEIIGRPDAAQLSRHQVGRAFVRTGSTEVEEVQVAYVGGSGAAAAGPVRARTFRIAPQARAPQPAAAAPADAPTDLARMVGAVVDAATLLTIPPQRRPWLPELGEAVSLWDLGTPLDAAPPTAVVGLLDDPDRQAQPPFVLDLESAGSAVIYGTSGTGKTTALRTIAASLARTYSTSEVHLYVLDATGRGLAALERLPHCGDVVSGTELERIRRLIALLTATATRRRARLGEVGASSVAEFRAASGEAMPAIVTLIDGFGQLWSAIDQLDRGIHAEALADLIGKGRDAGIYFVLTADRRSAVPYTLAGSIPERIVLRMATADEFGHIGLRAPQGFEKAPPGRAWSRHGELQLAVLDENTEATGIAQNRALAGLAQTLPSSPPEHAPGTVRLLPDHLPLADLPAPDAASSVIPIGLDEEAVAPAAVDFATSPLFLIVGPPQSGRTTAAATLAAGWRRTHIDADTYLLGTRRSRLFEVPGWTGTARGTEDASELCEQLAGQIAERVTDPPVAPLLIVIDDADDLVDGPAARHLETIVATARDANAVVVVAMTAHRAGRAYSGWVQHVRQARSGLILRPEADTTGEVLNARLPRRTSLASPPGRAYLVQGAAVSLIQVATSEDVV